MTQQVAFDSMLASWFDAEAPVGPPDTLLTGTLAVTSRTRPQPAWRAMLSVPVMRSASVVAVGSPSLRMTRVLFALLLVTALLAVSAAVGARLLDDRKVPPPVPTLPAVLTTQSQQPTPVSSPTPISTQFPELTPFPTPIVPSPGSAVIIYASMQEFGDPPPPVNWWECGDDQECIDQATGEGPTHGWVYTSRDDTTEPPVLVARIDIPRDALLARPLFSADGSWLAVGRTNNSCGYSVINVTTGDTEEFSSNQASWSPIANRLAYSTCDASGLDETVGVYDFANQTPRRILGESLDLPENKYERLLVLGWTADGGSVLVSRAILCDRSPLPCDPGTFELLAISGDGESTHVIQEGEYTWLGDAITQGSISPDMSKVAFGYGDGLQVAELDGSGRQRLGPNPCPGSISWSAGGDQIVFLDCQAVAEAASSVSLVDAPIVVVAPDGSTTLNIAATPVAAESSWTIATPPTFTPDGSKIYWSDVDGTWTINPDGTELTKLGLPANIAMTWGSSED